MGRHLRRRRLRGPGAHGPAHRRAEREDGLGRDRERRGEGRRRRSRSARPARRRAARPRRPRRRLVSARARQAGARSTASARDALVSARRHGGAFDGVALDIESTKLRNVGLRSQRAVALTRQLRRQRATRRWRSSRSTRAASSGARPRGRGFRGPTWQRMPTRSRRWSTPAAASEGSTRPTAT